MMVGVYFSCLIIGFVILIDDSCNDIFYFSLLIYIVHIFFVIFAHFSIIFVMQIVGTQEN